MDRENVNLSRADRAVNDTVGTPNDLPNLRILELGNGTARIREGCNLVDGGDQLADDNCRVLRRILGDEGVNRGEI